MKSRALLILISLTFVFELVISFLLISRIDSVAQDPVLINDCLYSVQDNFGDTGRYSQALAYAVIDNDGKLLYKNAEDISVSINEAIKHGDTMLDIICAEKTVGKIIFHNTATEEINSYRNTLMVAIAVISVIQLLLLLAYFMYLRRTIIKPFEKMNAFATRVAQGNLDTPLEIDRGHIFGSFTEAFDLMRSELKKSRAAEKKANDDKKEMVAKLSHDIKTPVASIKSTSELGYELSDNERIKEKFNQINIKSDQVTALVSNLFNSSINDITQIEVRPLPQPSSVIKEMIKNADYQSRAGEFSVPECRVYIDRLRLMQAFDNIFMNSYKYGGTDITVTADIEGDSLVVSIADEGPGVDDDILPLLKEKYRRGDNTEGKDGAGLGLFLTDYYITHMNGRVELENLHPGFGVKLYLRLTD